MKDKIKFKIPSKAEYLSLVRLSTAAIAQTMDFDIDTIEDLKMSISEACNIVLSSACEDYFVIQYKVKSQKSLEIEIEKSCPLAEFDENLNMSKIIIEALMDETEITDEHILMKLFK